MVAANGSARRAHGLIDGGDPAECDAVGHREQAGDDEGPTGARAADSGEQRVPV